MSEHKNQTNPNSFSSKYCCFYLVYFEEYEDVVEAIDREKQLKKRSRKYKEKLINETNPSWADLAEDWTT